MIIMKFGGTSLGTAESIQNVFRIVRDRVDQDPVLVVSAHAGVTNSLVEIARSAPGGDADVSQIEDFHHRLLEALDLPADLLDEQLGEMAGLARGMKLVSRGQSQGPGSPPEFRRAVFSAGSRGLLQPAGSAGPGGRCVRRRLAHRTATSAAHDRSRTTAGLPRT